MVFFCAGKIIIQGINIIGKANQYKYSNSAVAATLNGVFQREGKNYIVIGPTELWPDINPKVNVVINDNVRSENMEGLEDLINKVDFIILNGDYLTYKWEARFKNMYPAIRLEKVAEVGNSENNWYFLKIFKPVLP